MEKFFDNPTPAREIHEIPGVPEAPRGPTPEAPVRPSRSVLRDSGLNFEDITQFRRDFHNGSRPGGIGHKLIAWSFVAASIDALALFSVTCFALLGFSVLMKSRVQLVMSLFEGSFEHFGIYVCLAFLACYLITTRVFLGHTLGEWACGLRLGSLKQRLNRFYSLRVLARTILVFATGLFVMPCVSLLWGRDVLGRVIGLPLVSQREQKR